MRVTVVPWDPSWPAAFEEIRAELQAASAGVPIRSIEHVGSTSVPGLAAKPIIDVTVVVARPDVHAAIESLEAAGYRHLGEQGIADRHAFTAPPHGHDRHVYVAVEGAPALRNHLAVRDVLRADPALRDRYGAQKLALSQQDLPDVEAYVAAKTDLLVEVLRASGTLHEAEIDDIVRANRR